MIPVARNWWLYVLRGTVAILFGLIAFLVPGMALLTLVFLFGFYAISEGTLNLIAAYRRTGGQRSWALVIQGVLGVVAGLLAFLLPGITALALLIVIAAWAIASGVTAIIAAVRLRKQIRGEWMLGLSGVLSITLGVLLALLPGPGALALVLWIGAWACVFGALLIALGIRMRGMLRGAEPAEARLRPATAH